MFYICTFNKSWFYEYTIDLLVLWFFPVVMHSLILTEHVKVFCVRGLKALTVFCIRSCKI